MSAIPGEPDGVRPQQTSAVGQLTPRDWVVVAAGAVAVIGTWTALLVALVSDQFMHASPLAIAVLCLLVLLVIGGLVLWGVGHAGSRRR